MGLPARRARLPVALTIVLLSAADPAHAADGDQQVADGVTLFVPAGTYETTSNDLPALHALNGGVITANDVIAIGHGARSPGLEAFGTNSAIFFTGGEAVTDNSSALAVAAREGGRISLTGTRVRSTGAGGMSASGTASLDATDFLVQSTGGTAVSVSAQSSMTLLRGRIEHGGSGGAIVVTASTLLATDVDVLHTRDGSAGIIGGSFGESRVNGGRVSSAANNTVGVVVSNIHHGYVVGTTIEESGTGATGVRVTGNATGEITAASIFVGAQGRGATSQANSTLTGLRTSVVQRGTAGVGLESVGATSRLDWTEGSVDVEGAGVRGAHVSDTSSLALTDVDLRAVGDAAQGLHTETTGATTVSGSRFVVEGDGGRGILADGALVSLADVDLTVSGEAAVGLRAENVATLNATGSTIAVGGAQAAAAQITAGSTVTAASTTLTSAQGPALILDGGSFLASAATRVAGGTGMLAVLNSEAGSTIGFDGQSIAVGDIRAAAGADTDGNGTFASATSLTLANQSRWTGATDAVGAMGLRGGSLWTLTGDSTVGSLDMGDGTVDLSDIATGPFKTLTVLTNFSASGGVLRMNAALGDDGSPASMLAVHGNTTGKAFLQVTNVGGAGAYTPEGIRLVQVDGQSGAQFDLSGRAVGGAFEYFLFKGSRSGARSGDWFLRSELPVDPCLADPTGPGCPPPPDPCLADPQAPGCTPPPDPCTEDPAGPGCPGPVDPCAVEAACPPPVPVIRPEVGTYIANQRTMRGLFDTRLAMRSGSNVVGAVPRDGTDARTAAWAFTQGTQERYAVAGQLESRNHSEVLRVGTDLAAWGEGSRGVVGVTVAGATARSRTVSSLTDYVAAGRVDGYAAGAYATWWQRPDDGVGAFVDMLVQHGQYRSQVRGVALGKERYRSRSSSVSLEAGYAWRVWAGEGGTLFVEPSAQAIYTRLDTDDHREQSDTLVAFDSTGGWHGRAGLRVYGDRGEPAGARVRPYVSVNWLREDGANTVHFDGTAISGGAPADVYEARLGARLDFRQGWQAWMELGVQRGEQDYRSAAALFGIRRNW